MPDTGGGAPEMRLPTAQSFAQCCAAQRATSECHVVAPRDSTRATCCSLHASSNQGCRLLRGTRPLRSLTASHLLQAGSTGLNRARGTITTALDGTTAGAAQDGTCARVPHRRNSAPISVSAQGLPFPLPPCPSDPSNPNFGVHSALSESPRFPTPSFPQLAFLPSHDSPSASSSRDRRSASHLHGSPPRAG